ncbi:MAG TPA: porphobilinogen synthase [Planctomycetota bacterium]|nr:porphobilinogen synthase [Planctomycetota bacterium]
MDLRIRPRRNRRTGALRALAQETRLVPDQLILPLFVVPGERREEPVAAMPGVVRLSPDLLAVRAEKLAVRAVLVFGVPDRGGKDATGSTAVRDDALVPAAVRALRRARPELAIITDVCLCAYTDHGHCGALGASGAIDNDRTLGLLARMAEVHAAAGADLVAPSAMADGQVRAIRERLDGSGFAETGIVSYAAKFASAFYGPFREAAGSRPAFGDRRAYQLPPANRREAVRDALLDEAEGAEWLMVKPALPYLDVISDLRAASRLPVAAYQVSGEYAMLKHAAAAGALDERSAAMESLLAIRRAGADAIVTYYAEEAGQWLDR